MGMIDELRAVRSAGFETLYPLYGATVSITVQGSGTPHLGVPGSAETLATVRALVFQIRDFERIALDMEVGEEGKKFVFHQVDGLSIDIGKCIQYNGKTYEIFKPLDRDIFGECRAVCKKLKND